MFTGIIEEIGKVESVLKSARSARVTIKAQKMLEDIKSGDSIATNGICLTVTGFDRSGFTVDVMPETMQRTNLNKLFAGAEVNLERALRAGDRLGGHIVSGHIDGTGRIMSIEKDENAIWLAVSAEPSILRYIVEKGSVAIDGVSLTVAYVDDSIFKVSVIPHTGEYTTLSQKRAGDILNLECDIIGKYVEKLLGATENTTKKGIDFRFLNKNGFI